MTAKKAQPVAEPVLISAEDLAAKVKRDGKTVRAFLRKNFARKSEQKGARWTIVVGGDIEKAVVDHYAALDSRSEKIASTAKAS